MKDKNKYFILLSSYIFCLRKLINPLNPTTSRELRQKFADEDDNGKFRLERVKMSLDKMAERKDTFISTEDSIYI